MGLLKINGKNTSKIIINKVVGIEGVTQNGSTIKVQGNNSADSITIYDSKDINTYGTHTINPYSGNITINYMGATCGSVTAENLEAENIKSGVNILGVTGTFEGSSNDRLKTLLDTTKNASWLFYEYKGNNLKDLIQYNDTENVTKINSLFRNCINATELPKINTYKVTNWEYAYNSCIKVNKIDIDYYSCTSVNYCNFTFAYCVSLKAVIIRSFGEEYVITSSWFNGCCHILGTTDSTYNPEGLQDGYIYVPRDMIETLSSETNWSTVATQFRALEDYIIPNADGTIDLLNGEFDDTKAGLV